MKLYTFCKGCKKETFIKSTAVTRPDLAHDKGEEISINCNNCGKRFAKHVNEIKAKPDPKILGIGLVVSIVVTAILLLFLGVIGSICLGIPLLFWQQQNSNAQAFNGYRI